MALVGLVSAFGLVGLVIIVGLVGVLGLVGLVYGRQICEMHQGVGDNRRSKFVVKSRVCMSHTTTQLADVNYRKT